MNENTLPDALKIMKNNVMDQHVVILQSKHGTKYEKHESLRDLLTN